jgi:hypothetical protein
MRSWIRWSSLALALCNTGCGDYELECAEGLQFTVSPGSEVDIAELVTNRCTAYWKPNPGGENDKENRTFSVVLGPVARGSPLVVSVRSVGGLDWLAPGPAGAINLVVPPEAKDGQLIELSVELYLDGLPRKGGGKFTFLVGANRGDVYGVRPAVINIAQVPAPAVEMLAVFEPVTMPATLIWRVQSPQNAVFEVKASAEAGGRFSSSFVPTDVGIHLLTPIADGVEGPVQVVEVNRGVRFTGSPRVESYSQTQESVLAVSMDLSDEVQGPSAVVVTGEKLDSYLPPEIVRLRGSNSDFCGLAQLLNQPEAASVARSLRGTHIATVAMTDQLEVEITDGVAETIRANRCDSFIGQVTPVQPRPSVTYGPGRCRRAIWTNDGVTTQLDDGVYRLKACVTSAVSAPGPYTSAQLSSNCDAEKIYFVGFRARKAKCDAAP